MVVFSNCDEVALSVNGKLVKRQRPDSGPGHLIRTESVHVEVGVASVLLQATTQPGKITVWATAEGLKTDSETITSVIAPADVSRTPALP